MEPIWGILKHDLKRAELQFSLAKAPQEVEGQTTLRLENLMGTLGSDLQDFFFGCRIRGIQSRPINAKYTPRPEDPDIPAEEQQEPPLKTVKVWLEFPIDSADSLPFADSHAEQPSTKSVKVEVRIFKAGGSSRNF